MEKKLNIIYMKLWGSLLVRPSKGNIRFYTFLCIPFGERAANNANLNRLSEFIFNTPTPNTVWVNRCFDSKIPPNADNKLIFLILRNLSNFIHFISLHNFASLNWTQYLRSELGSPIT